MTITRSHRIFCKIQVYTACKLLALQNGEEKLVATGETLLTPVGDGS